MFKVSKHVPELLIKHDFKCQKMYKMQLYLTANHKLEKDENGWWYIQLPGCQNCNVPHKTAQCQKVTSFLYVSVSQKLNIKQV